MDGKQEQRQEEFQLPAGAKRLHNHEAVATVLKRVAQEKVKWIDFQFVDLLGQLQHVSVPAHTLEYENFGEGVGKLDGSSIKGFKDIHESDMLLRPDPETFAVLPWYGEQHKTARMYSDVFEGASSTRFSRDPRYVAQKAEQAAASMGYDTTYWGPELEFFVFDSVKITPNATAARAAPGHHGGLPERGLPHPDGGLRHGLGRPPPRGRDRGTRRNRHEIRPAGAHGRPGHYLQAGAQDDGPAHGQGLHVHAQTHLRRQRLGHARPPESLEERQEHVLRDRKSDR